jgi:hypothetical protein
MKWIIRTALISATVFFGTALLANAVSADTSNTNSNSQTAMNGSATTQAGAAISGNATSLESSTATSGNAVASAFASLLQKNSHKAANQVAAVVDCECQLPWVGAEGVDTTNANANTQMSGNDKTLDQNTGAISGDASAEDDSESTTGAADSILEDVEEQINKLKALNQGLFQIPEEEEEEEAP